MAEPRFSPPPRSNVIERAASTIAFVTLLGSWCLVYAVICPGDVRPARHEVAALVRP